MADGTTSSGSDQVDRLVRRRMTAVPADLTDPLLLPLGQHPRPDDGIGDAERGRRLGVVLDQIDEEQARKRMQSRVEQPDAKRPGDART
ncbi:MAG: hypothetical protein JWL79_3096 [Frankiales bacterium]|nr:hypothetical protein [Frankiales bacterium]